MVRVIGDRTTKTRIQRTEPNCQRNLNLWNLLQYPATKTGRGRQTQRHNGVCHPHLEIMQEVPYVTDWEDKGFVSYALSCGCEARWISVRSYRM